MQHENQENCMGAQYYTPKITGVFKSKTTTNSTDKREGSDVSQILNGKATWVKQAQMRSQY
jgi:hypothetical protein